MPARHEGLLVGRRHDLAGGQRGQHRPEADHPAGPDDDQVDVVAGRQGLERVCAADPRGPGREVERLVRGQRNERGSKGAGLLGQYLPAPAGRQRDHAEPIGMTVQDVHRLAADRTRGAE